MADEIELNMGQLDLTHSNNEDESSIDHNDVTGEGDNGLAEDAHEATGSDDESEDSCSASDEEGSVPVTRLLAALETSRKRKRKLDSARSEVRTLRQRITTLEQERSARERSQERERRTVRTWPDVLETYLNGNPYGYSYGDLVAQSQVEGNQSPKFSHPNLRLRPPTPEEMRKEMERKENETSKQENRGYATDRRSTTKLGLDIEARVLQYALRFNEGIHAISRLDPFLVPESPECLPRDGFGKLTYLRRYHVGSRSCNLTLSALRPSELLAPLLVDRRWHIIGSHIFFTNKFIFSSLGELGRWCGGIGRKIALVSRVEIFLIGSQHLTYPINDRKKYVSRRTQPLMHLPQCLRLRELRVYLRETAPHYVRRRHETRGVIRYAKQLTHDHPNYRETRNLHCIQGLDYIYALRGLVFVEFFDYDQWLEKGKKNEPVRDTDFVEAIRTAVLREKPLKDYVRSRLINLAPLLPAFDPPANDNVWECLKAIGVDRLELGPSRNAAEDVGSEQSDTDSESDSDTDSESESGTSSPSNSKTDPRLGSADEPITVDSDSDSVHSSYDDASRPARAGAATGRQTTGSIDLTDDTADERTMGSIDLTNDGDFGNMGQTLSGERSLEESPLFVEDEMSDTKDDTDIKPSRSPPASEQIEKIESFEREESDLFVSDDSEVVDLTNGE